MKIQIGDVLKLHGTDLLYQVDNIYFDISDSGNYMCFIKLRNLTKKCDEISSAWQMEYLLNHGEMYPPSQEAAQKRYHEAIAKKENKNV